MYRRGSALANAGPAPLFIGYTVVGFLCFLVMAALGEVRTSDPLEIVGNNQLSDGRMAPSPFIPGLVPDDGDGLRWSEHAGTEGFGPMSVYLHSAPQMRPQLINRYNQASSTKV